MKGQRPNPLVLVLIALAALAALAVAAVLSKTPAPLRHAVSVDPRGDTVAAVRSWLKLHREPANFHYLIGSEKELRPTWDAYFVAPQIPGDPNSSHTAAIWLVNSHGQRQTEINVGAPVAPADLAYDFQQLLRGR